MLTIFAICKPFTDPHIATIQKTAIQSWQRIYPTPEIFLFGDRDGVKGMADDLGVTFMSGVKRGDTGRDLMSDAFYQANMRASNDILCYSNADMIYPPNLLDIVRAIDCERYLVIGERLDTPITDPISFHANWWPYLKAYVDRHGHSPGACSMDYFIFKRGEFMDMPDIAAGAWFSDNWLVGTALKAGIPVIDATQVITAIHQNHTHAYYPGGLQGIANGAESAQAKAVLPDGQVFNLAHATVKLLP